jgi:hypothetical protein
LLIHTNQEGNEGSFRIANHWATHFSDPYCKAMIQVRRKSVALPHGSAIRPAIAEDYSFIAKQLNAFYKDFVFYTPKSAESLHYELNRTVRTISHFIITNQDNQPVAGITIGEEFRVRTMRVSTLSLPLLGLNKIVRLIPPAGELRPVTCWDLWHTPNSAETARLLFQTVRYRYRDSADVLLFTYDQKTSLGEIVQPPFWIPKGKLSIAINAPIPSDNPIYPLR